MVAASSEPYCSVFFEELKEDKTGLTEIFPSKQAGYRWTTSSADRSRSKLTERSFYPTGAESLPSKRGEQMHPEDLMKPDLLSEIVLSGFGILTFSSLLLFVAAAFARP